DGRNHCGPCGNRETHEVTFRTRLGRFFRLQIEAGEPQSSADNKCEARNRPELMHMHGDISSNPFSSRETPTKSKNPRCDTKCDEVGKGIELDAEIACSFR